VSQNGSVKSILYALAANGAIAVAKFVAAFITSSGSMLAEAIHSTADCANQVLLLWGLKVSKRPPSGDFPLGEGKQIYFWSFIVAVMLFSVGGLFSIYEGVHKLSATEPLTSPMIAVGVLVFGIIVEALSLFGCMKEIQKSLRGRGYWQWFRESRQSELVVIFGEDIAAVFGLIFALVAVVLTWLTANPVFDALGSITIGILLIVVAVLIGRQVMDLMIGRGVEPYLRKEIIAFIESQDGVVKVFNLVTLQLGSDIMLAAKVKMDYSESSQQVVVNINNCEVALRAKYDQILWSFFEPDLVD